MLSQITRFGRKCSLYKTGLTERKLFVHLWGRGRNKCYWQAGAALCQAQPGLPAEAELNLKCDYHICVVLEKTFNLLQIYFADFTYLYDLL
jgi:hypothetical protein